MSVAGLHNAPREGLVQGTLSRWVAQHGFAAVLAFCLACWAVFAGLAYLVVKSFF
jgi:hypothetical protein